MNKTLDPSTIAELLVLASYKPSQAKNKGTEFESGFSEGYMVAKYNMAKKVLENLYEE